MFSLNIGHLFCSYLYDCHEQEQSANERETQPEPEQLTGTEKGKQNIDKIKHSSSELDGEIRYWSSFCGSYIHIQFILSLVCDRQRQRYTTPNLFFVQTDCVHLSLGVCMSAHMHVWWIGCDVTVGRTKSFVTFFKLSHLIGLEFQMMILLNRIRMHKCECARLLVYAFFYCNMNFFLHSELLCIWKCFIARSANCKEKQMLTNTNTVTSRILPRQRRDDQQVEAKNSASIKIIELENGSNGCICVTK